MNDVIPSFQGLTMVVPWVLIIGHSIRIRYVRCSMVFWCMVFMRFLVLGFGIGGLFIYLFIVKFKLL